MTEQPVNRRWSAVVATGMLAVGFGASLGFLPGYFVGAVRDDLGISRAQVGLLVSVHFGCTGLGSILGARVVRRVGTRAAVVIDQLIVAVAAWMAALVGSYIALLVAAVFAGLGYALANIATNQAIAASVPASRLSLALSARTSGVPIMALVGSALVPWFSDRWSWNAVVMATGTLAVVSAIVASVVLPSTRSRHSVLRTAQNLPKGFLWFAVAAFFLVGSSQPLFSWVIHYLDEALGMSELGAGSISATASGIGVVGMFVSGLYADRIGPARRVPFIIGLCTVLTAATLVIMSGVHLGVAVASVGVIIAVISQLAAVGTMHAALVDRAPEAVARASGVMMTGYYLGALVSPVGFGALVDWLGTYTWAWLVMAAGSAAAVASFTRVSKVGQV